jgi:hypothetical protein
MKEGAPVFSDLLQFLHASASDFIGVVFVVILMVPVLLASFVDLNADEMNHTD